MANSIELYKTGRLFLAGNLKPKYAMLGKRGEEGRNHYRLKQKITESVNILSGVIFCFAHSLFVWKVSVATFNLIFIHCLIPENTFMFSNGGLYKILTNFTLKRLTWTFERFYANNRSIWPEIQVYIRLINVQITNNFPCKPKLKILIKP